MRALGVLSIGARARTWTLTVLMTFCFCVSARADDSSSPATVLQADRVRFWDAEGTRWIWLDGDATAFQGDPTPALGRSALVRVQSRESDSGPIGHVDVFIPLDAAEDPETPAEPRVSFVTTQKVILRARTADGVTKLEQAPSEAIAFIAALDQPRSPPERKPALVAPEQPNTPPAPLGMIEQPQVAQTQAQPAVDPKVVQVQDPFEGLDRGAPLTPPEIDAEPVPSGIEPPVVLPSVDDPPPTDAEPLPNAGPVIVPGPDPNFEGALIPQSRRRWSITPRYGGRPFQPESINAADGSTAIVVRGGIIIVAETTEFGRVDLAADSAVIWSRPRADGSVARVPNPAAGPVEQDGDTPLEVYLEGDVIIRHDRLQEAGAGDQTTFKARQAFYDFQTDRVLAVDGEFNVFAPGLITPMRTQGSTIQHYHEPLPSIDGRPRFGPAHVRIDRASSTGSRFPEPGYRFNSNSIELTEVQNPLTDPATGGRATPLHARNDAKEINWLIDARSNTYYIGPVPFFYWPRFRAESDDLDPPIRNLGFRYGNYFGYQVLSDWDGFKLLGIERPKNIDNWNVDIDFLSFRGPALGSEVGWFGRDLIADFLDPYGKNRAGRTVDHPYFGYSDSWGIIDHRNDTLGTGPAVITYGPPGAGDAGFQRDSVPTFNNQRGRFLTRHMQSFLGPDAEPDDELRVQFEMAGYSDRHFLEQYYKRLFDSGLDQDTLAYAIYQRRNRAVTLTGQANFMDWITDTQWLPKLEYYRIGDSLLDNRLSYSSNYGVNYANVHTAAEVNNPNLFAFLPYDPISNTSQPFESGRAWTTQQVEMPLKLGFTRIVPYLQGQLIGWNNQLDYQTTGRAWGAYGIRGDIMAWKIYSEAESELLNIHGLAHKATLNIDYRSAYSTYSLNRVGVQDVLDDDTYEFGRRYFAMTNYVGGLLPNQYDPRLLTLRRTLNPVVFAPDIQDSIETFTVGLYQRLQTKRGPDGRRRIVDWMVLDAKTTFFPQSDRDNFGEPMGQTMYNYEWFIGDRTSFISTGWFEFWDIVGDPILVTEPRKTNDPFGLRVINAGVSINRPPRGNVYFGYSIINTGPIATSALNSAFNYWLSPKWYATFATSYDFGNAILLGSTFSITKIGADFLTSVGLSVDPQRQNYTFGFEIAPRFSPNVRLGSAVGSRFDSRFAPTE